MHAAATYTTEIAFCEDFNTCFPHRCNSEDDASHLRLSPRQPGRTKAKRININPNFHSWMATDVELKTTDKRPIGDKITPTCLARSSRSMLPEEKKGESGSKRLRAEIQKGNDFSSSLACSTSISSSRECCVLSSRKV